MSNQKSERTIIKANSGFFVAIYIEAGSAGNETWPHYFVLDDVIAWDIERTAGENYIVRPITVDATPSNMRNMRAIKKPDGTYNMPGECAYDTEEKALEHCRRSIEEDRRQKASA
jgi:hypothetical protein